MTRADFLRPGADVLTADDLDVEGKKVVLYNPATQQMEAGGQALVSGARVLNLPTNTGAAAENVAAIQAAFETADRVILKAAGGQGGVISGNQLLLLDDFKTLEVAEGSELKLSNGTNTPLLRNRNWNAAKRAATGPVTWAALATPVVGEATADTAYGYLMTFPLTAHGFAIGDAVEFEGATDFGWNGTRLVYSVPNANTITVVLERPPVNANPTGTLTVKRGNKYITLTGGGRINANGHNQSVGGDTNTFAIPFKGVYRPTVRGLCLTRGKKYVINFANCSRVTVDDIELDTDSDGIHFQGSIWGAVINNIHGKSGDDFVAFTGGDYSYYTEGVGDFDGIEISNIYPQTCIYAVKFTGNDQHRYGSVTVRNLRGVARHGALYGQNDTDQDKVRIDNLLIDTVDVQSTNPASWANILFRSIEVKKLTIRNVYARSPNQIQVSIDNPTAADVVDIVGIYAKNGGQTLPVVYTGTTATVGTLRLSQCDVTLGSTGTPLFVRQAGPLTQVILSKNTLVGAGANSRTYQQDSTATGLTLFEDDDNIVDNVHSVFDQINNLSNGSQKIAFHSRAGRRTNIVGQGFNIRGAHDTDFTLGFPLWETVTNNVVFLNSTATGSHSVQGEVAGQQGRKVVGRNAGPTAIYVRGWTLGADVTQMTSRGGDYCYNVNTIAAPGAGLVSCDGSAWRRVARSVQTPVSVGNATAANLANGQIIATTLSENTTVSAPTNLPAQGERVTFQFTQDATGGRTVAWNAAYVFPAAWSNTGNTAGKKCVAEFVSDGSALVLLSQSSWY